jgi:outer membrane protein assembly factor BamB
MYKAILAMGILFLAASARAEDWPQWMGPKRDDVWSETGILDTFPKDGPRVKWRMKIGGGYSGPAVAAGKVYVTDFQGDTAKKEFHKEKFKGVERVLCLNAEDGKQIWEYKYDCTYTVQYPAGPRCTPTLEGGKVYALGAEGNLVCLDAEKGTLVWNKDFKKDYQAVTPQWGFCSHPLVDGDKLFCIVGGKDSIVVAFDKNTGKEIWKALSAKEPGYCPPTMIEAGGKKQLLIWHSESLNSLNPDSGVPYWSVKLAPSYGMAIMAPRRHGDFLFAAGNGDQAVCLKLATDKPDVTEVWRGKKSTALYPINSTPFLDDGIIYGVDQPGLLRGVKLETGERLWEASEPVNGKDRAVNSGTAFITKNGDRFFLFNEIGQLIIAKLTPKGYEEVAKAKILDPTGTAFGRDVVWSHPAFANKCCYARNDSEIVCVDLSK